MLEIEDALAKLSEVLLQHSVTETISLPISEANNHILALPAVSEIDVPPANNSAMDGYALNTKDIQSLPYSIKISQRITAGSTPTALVPNTAARIFTGAEIPKGADCVVIQENTETVPGSDYVTISEGLATKNNIRAQGQDIKRGQTIFHSGHRVKPQDIGLLSSIGITEVLVKRQLRVAIISTGNELVQPGAALSTGQIYDSNRPMINEMCKTMQCDIIASLHISDGADTTIETFNKVKNKCDLIISCGGVSVGEEDHVKNAVSQLGEVDFWKVRIKPGKPIAFGKLNRTDQKPCLFLGLPGNPVSAFVTMHIFGKLVLATLQGQLGYKTQKTLGVSNFRTSGRNNRPEFIRVKSSELGFEAYQNQSSGALSSVCWADALALVPEQTAVSPGDTVSVFPI